MTMLLAFTNGLITLIIAMIILCHSSNKNSDKVYANCKTISMFVCLYTYRHLMHEQLLISLPSLSMAGKNTKPCKVANIY